MPCGWLADDFTFPRAIKAYQDVRSFAISLSSCLMCCYTCVCFKFDEGVWCLLVPGNDMFDSRPTERNT